jgi:hypothetical protein
MVTISLGFFARSTVGGKTMKSRSVQLIACVSVFLAVAACTSQTVKMIQPETGATAECSGSSYGFGQLFTESFVDSCSRLYENRGYVALQRLSPEDRARLKERGLLPKD